MSRAKAGIKCIRVDTDLANRQDVGRIQGSTAEDDMSQSPGSRDLVDSGVMDGPGPNHDN